MSLDFNFTDIATNPIGVLSLFILLNTLKAIANGWFHAEISRFDVALSKMTPQIDEFWVKFHIVKTNINNLPYEKLSKRNAQQLDEYLTTPIMNFRISCTLTLMYFRKDADRHIFLNLLDIVERFNTDLHNIFINVTTDKELQDKYESLRMRFNQESNVRANSVINLLSEQIYGRWQRKPSIMMRLFGWLNNHIKKQSNRGNLIPDNA